MTDNLARMFLKLCERYATEVTFEDIPTMTKCVVKLFYN
jgi:hypothetical protein